MTSWYRPPRPSSKEESNQTRSSRSNSIELNLLSNHKTYSETTSHPSQSKFPCNKQSSTKAKRHSSSNQTKYPETMETMMFSAIAAQVNIWTHSSPSKVHNISQWICGNKRRIMVLRTRLSTRASYRLVLKIDWKETTKSSTYQMFPQWNQAAVILQLHLNEVVVV